MSHQWHRSSSHGSQFPNPTQPVRLECRSRYSAISGPQTRPRWPGCYPLRAYALELALLDAHQGREQSSNRMVKGPFALSTSPDPEPFYLYPVA